LLIHATLFKVDFRRDFMKEFIGMRTIKSIISVVVLLHIVGAGFVWGQKFSVRASGGVIFPKEGNVDAAFAFGFGISYSIIQNIWISLDLGYWKNDVTEGTEKLHQGRLIATPFLVSIHYEMLKTKKFAPYLSIGYGYILYDFWLGDIITIPEITVTQNVENGPAWFGGLGGQIRVWERTSVYAETVYLYSKPDGKTIILDMNFGVSREEFSVDMRSIIIRLGIRYHF